MNNRKPSTVTKSADGRRSSSRAEGGVTKRLPIKKMYCTKCKKLVKGLVQSSGDSKGIICPICGLHLWVWKSLSWTSVKNPVFSSA